MSFLSIRAETSYAYAFQLLFEYASNCLKIRPSELHLEQLDAPLIVKFLDNLETARGNGPNSRNIRLAALKSFECGQNPWKRLEIKLPMEIILQ